MRLLLAALLLLPSLARAQPAASAEVLGLARGAHAAGVRGDCVGARVLGARIRRLDPDFHAAVILTDPSITACKPRPRVYAAELPRLPAPASPRQPDAVQSAASPGIDPGLLIGGGTLGTLAGLSGIAVGYYVLRATCDDECSAGGPLFAVATGGLVIVASTTATVYFIGRRGTIDGSFGATMIGSLVGLLGALAIATSIDTPDGANQSGIVLALVGLPTVGAITGFTLTSHDTASPAPRVPSPRLSDDATILPLFARSF